MAAKPEDNVSKAHLDVVSIATALAVARTDVWSGGGPG
jgi:hypothetical protein